MITSSRVAAASRIWFVLRPVFPEPMCFLTGANGLLNLTDRSARLLALRHINGRAARWASDPYLRRLTLPYRRPEMHLQGLAVMVLAHPPRLEESEFGLRVIFITPYSY